MRALSVLGTAAMFLVGGGILAHGLHPIEEAIHHLAETTGPGSGLVGQALSGVFGVVAGGLVLGFVLLGKRLFRRA